MLESTDVSIQTLGDRIERLKFVLNLTRNLNSKKCVDEILRSIVNDGVRAVSADRSALFLLDAHGQRLTSQFAKGLAESRISVDAHAGLAGHIAQTGASLNVPDVYLDKRFNRDVDRETGYRTRSLIGAPLRNASGKIIGVLQALNRLDGQPFEDDDLEILECLAAQAAVALENARAYRSLLEAKETIHGENVQLKERLFGELIGVSTRIGHIRDLACKMANSSVKVLISGERGTGKSLLARLIHFGGECTNRPFVHFNLAAVPEGCVETQLFGEGETPGKLELAAGGTLFLDEVGAMPSGVQKHLFGFLQNGRYSRLGDCTSRTLQVRIVSATNQDLDELVRSGKFLADLYYRLNVVHFHVPPLRSRSEDVRPLIEHLCQRLCRELNHKLPSLAPETYAVFEEYAWPGNVRELQNELTRLIVSANGDMIRPEALSQRIRSGNGAEPGLNLPDAVRELERSLIIQALEASAGNKVQAARLLSISREGLRRKMHRYQLDACTGGNHG